MSPGTAKKLGLSLTAIGVCVALVAPFVLTEPAANDGTSRASAAATFQDIAPEDAGVKITVPSRWTTLRTRASRAILAVSDPASGSTANVVIMDDVDLEFDDLRRTIIHTTSEEYTVTSPPTSVTVGVLPAVNLELESTAGGDPIAARMVILEGNDAYYVLTLACPVPSFESNRRVFEEIVESFQEGDFAVDSEADRDDGAKDGEDEQPQEAEVKQVTEESLLALLKDGSANVRLQVVASWRAKRFDKAPGARVRMLEALGETIDASIVPHFLESFAGKPADVAEALACLAHPLPEALGRPLLEELGRSGAAQADAVAEALSKVEETRDLLVEETCVLIGRPREGAAQRLVEGRGLPWAQSREGQELLGLLAKDVAQLTSLAASDDPELRTLGCALALGGEPAKAVRQMLSGLLKDEDSEVRSAAATALRDRGDARATWFLALALAREKNAALRAHFEACLAGLPEADVVRFLHKLYAKKNARARIAAVRAARAFTDGQAISLLFKAVGDRREAIAIEALQSLAALKKRSKKRSELARLLHADLAVVEKATRSKNREVSRAAKHCYFTLTGRLPSK